jgi:hypothetical protein
VTWKAPTSICTLAIVVATATTPAMPGVTDARARLTPGAQLDRIFRLGTLCVATDERDMRHCDDPASVTRCGTAIENLQTKAITWLNATGRIPQSELSSFGRTIRTNLLHEFQRYYLAADAFGRGIQAAYVAQLRQAVSQGAAASTRLAARPFFNYLMTLARCGAWQIRLRVPGESPCE